jgi:hypothetical protein
MSDQEFPDYNQTFVMWRDLRVGQIIIRYTGELLVIRELLVITKINLPFIHIRDLDTGICYTPQGWRGSQVLDFNVKTEEESVGHSKNLNIFIDVEMKPKILLNEQTHIFDSGKTELHRSVILGREDYFCDRNKELPRFSKHLPDVDIEQHFASSDTKYTGGQRMIQRYAERLFQDIDFQPKSRSEENGEQ